MLLALIQAAQTLPTAAQAESAMEAKKPETSNLNVSASGTQTETKPQSETRQSQEKAATATVLNPEQFFGNAKSGYMAAKTAPDVCSKLFCYCGCDLTDEHTSLLDCFTSDHGVDCHICQEEALIGLKLKREGKTTAEIQKTVDIMFHKQYPFDEVSPALKKYRQERLWKGNESDFEKASIKSGQTKSAAPAGAKGTDRAVPIKTPQPKSSQHKGSCCGHKH